MPPVPTEFEIAACRAPRKRLLADLEFGRYTKKVCIDLRSRLEWHSRSFHRGLTSLH